MTVRPIATEFESFQSFLINSYNRKVRESFKDEIEIDDVEWGQMNNEQRARRMLTITDNDNSGMMTLKMMSFLFLRLEQLDEYYGVPKATFQSENSYSPQIILKFKETAKDAKSARRKNHARLNAQIVIMLPLTTRDLNRGRINEFKNEINRSFPPSFEWKKGRELYSYYDKENKQRLKLACLNESTAKTLIQKVLGIVDQTPNLEYLNKGTKTDFNFNLPRKKTIPGYGVVEMRSLRPLGNVKLYRAELHAPGVEETLIIRNID